MNCVFLDRDGTLIRHVPYLCDPTQVQLLPTVVEGLELLKSSGCKLFLHTNQSGIGRGYFSLQQAHACNEAMLRQIGLGPQLFVDVRICPEAPHQQIVYRKPSPRYGQEMLVEYSLRLSDICYLGDSVSDLLTAKNLGCTGVGVNTGLVDLRGELQQRGLQEAFKVHDSFLQAASYVASQCRSAL